MPIQTVHTEHAPAAIGPYSQATIAGGMIYCSGQIPLDPATGKLVDGDIGAQTHAVLNNLFAVLAAGGSGPEWVVKTTVYLKSMGDFPEMNAVYAARFGESRPARATVEVARLPRDVAVEIDCVAVVATPVARGATASH
jgi:2-iminobutanoate/2-iminopropanoate deaminase